MKVEIKSAAGTITADLPEVPAPGDSITRYDGATETTLRVAGRRWVIDQGEAPYVIIRAEVTGSATQD